MSSEKTSLWEQELKQCPARNPRTAGFFTIRGIPTSIVFRGGKETDRLTGAVPKAQLEKLLSG